MGLQLAGDHVIMLDVDPLSEAAAIEALHVCPGIPSPLVTSERFYMVHVFS